MGTLIAASAIVLAGGRSRRFGGDKLAADVAGAPLLHHAIRAVASVCDEVLVVGPPSGVGVELPSDVHAGVVLDVEAYRGPLAAVAHASGVARRDRLLLVGGDMPGLVPAVLARLLAWEAGADGACLVAEGWARPLPLALSRAAVQSHGVELVAAGQRSLRALMDGLRLEHVSEAAWRRLDPDRTTLRDIDRREDV